jgi:hypothetical protein
VASVHLEEVTKNSLIVTRGAFLMSLVEKQA